MRLLELGQKAYPHSDRECLKEVQYHFLNTVPREFSSYLRQSEQMIKVVDKERKLKWMDIMKLAEDEDQQQEKAVLELKKQETRMPPKVWFSREETRNSSNGRHEDQAKSKTGLKQTGPPIHNSRVYTPRTSSSPVARAAGSAASCQLCGRSGHSVDVC